MSVVGNPDDERIADYRHLRDAPDSPHVIVEGIVAVRHLLGSGRAVRSVLLSPQARLALEAELVAADVTVLEATTDVLSAIVGFNLHRGVIASAERWTLPPWRSVVEGAHLVMVTEGLNDHENLGALFRNAAAFGVDAVLLDPTTADPLYRRAVRVSSGHALTLPFTRIEPWPDVLRDLGSMGFDIVALSPSGGQTMTGVVLGDRIALVVGAEGPGLSARTMEAAHRQVRIPMASGVDSLNVATATAVTLYEIAARRVASTTAMRSGPHGSGKMMGDSTPAST